MQNLSAILAPTRIACRVPTVSKKRLFETIARLVCDDQPFLAFNDLKDKLVEREDLGSTGLGQGIALPHCRIGNCPSPLGSILTLESPLGFDAPDEQPVDLLFVLLVPEEAHQEHLDILAAVARQFSQPEYCAQLRAATNSDELYAAAIAGSS